MRPLCGEKNPAEGGAQAEANKEADRDMPADRLLPQQEKAACQPGDIHPLPAQTCQHAAVDRQLQHLLNAMSGMQEVLKVSSGGSADAVDTQPQTGHVASGGGMTGEDHLQRVAECRDMGGYLIGRQPEVICTGNEISSTT